MRCTSLCRAWTSHQLPDWCQNKSHHRAKHPDSIACQSSCMSRFGYSSWTNRGFWIFRGSLDYWLFRCARRLQTVLCYRRLGINYTLFCREAYRHNIWCSVLNFTCYNFDCRKSFQKKFIKKLPAKRKIDCHYCEARLFSVL